MGNPMSPEETTSYGIGALVAIIILRDLLPLLIKMIFPARAEAAKLKLSKEATIAEQERKHRQDLETRQVAAIEEIARATDANAKLMEAFRVLSEQMEERLTNLERLSYQMLKGIEILLDRDGVDPQKLERAPLSKEPTRPVLHHPHGPGGQRRRRPGAPK